MPIIPFRRKDSNIYCPARHDIVQKLQYRVADLKLIIKKNVDKLHIFML